MNAAATSLLNRLLARAVSTDAKPREERRKHRAMWHPGPSNFRGSQDSQFGNSRRIGFHRS